LSPFIHPRSQMPAPLPKRPLGCPFGSSSPEPKVCIVYVTQYSHHRSHAIGRQRVPVARGAPLPLALARPTPHCVHRAKPCEPAQVCVEIYVDFTCPFSTKIYDTMTLSVIPSYMRRDSDALKVVFHQTPQTWHPQGILLHEAALAVQMVKPECYAAMYAQLMEAAPEQFNDAATYDKSRTDIYQELAELAVAAGVDHEAFLTVLMLDTSGGQKNSGNSATGALKLVTKHHRQRGIHVTPTCAVNGIICDTSSGWTLAEWQAFLDPLVGEAEPEPVETVVSAPPLLGGLSRTRSFGGLVPAGEKEQVEALFTAEMKAAMGEHVDGVDASTEVAVLKFAAQVVAGKNYFVKVELLQSSVLLDIVHVRVFVPLGGAAPELHGLLRGKTLEEEVEFFQGFNC
jgi:hypothetical protein